jgi:hypothetical protein
MPVFALEKSLAAEAVRTIPQNKKSTPPTNEIALETNGTGKNESVPTIKSILNKR